MPPKNRWIILVTFCSLLVGVFLVFQLKAQAKVPRVTTADNILPVLIERDQENARLKAENDRLNSELQKLKQGVDAALLANEQLKRARLISGLELVKGPGLRIILDDSHREDIDKGDVNQYIIHEQYLREIVNALWNAKAEAIAINDQRVTAQTEILCVYNVMYINGKVQTPPFIISAIGDTQNLLKGVDFIRFDLGSLAKNYGITYKKEPVKELKLPAGRAREFRFAVPVKEGI